ncbi:hypothetical protein LINGRAHAP2_LOCUS32566 [Linum grandiflorum]
MGGKGLRRREKNYRAAHGGDSRLPPPPDASKHDAFPSKLRQLMTFVSTPHDNGSDKLPPTKKRKGGAVDEPPRLVKENLPTRAKQSVKDDDDDNGGGESKKKNKKRKRNQVKDLRFESLTGNTKTKEKRKERKKKYLEAKKKKKNHNSEAEGNADDFPGKDHVQFGDVVQAPPKLKSVPKGAKKVIDASKERLRLQAIENYRNRKGWKTRPGIQLPSITM